MRASTHTHTQNTHIYKCACRSVCANKPTFTSWILCTLYRERRRGRTRVEAGNTSSAQGSLFVWRGCGWVSFRISVGLSAAAELNHQPMGTTCIQLPLFLTRGTNTHIRACVRRHAVAVTLFPCWRKLRLIRSRCRPHFPKWCRNSALLHAAYRKKKDWIPGSGGWEQMTEWNASLSNSYGFCFLRHLMDSELPLHVYRLGAAGCFIYSFRCCFKWAALNSNHLINYCR